MGELSLEFSSQKKVSQVRSWGIENSFQIFSDAKTRVKIRIFFPFEKSHFSIWVNVLTNGFCIPTPCFQCDEWESSTWPAILQFFIIKPEILCKMKAKKVVFTVDFITNRGPRSESISLEEYSKMRLSIGPLYQNWCISFMTLKNYLEHYTINHNFLKKQERE